MDSNRLPLDWVVAERVAAAEMVRRTRAAAMALSECRGGEGSPP
jgi:hypothetical protein